MVKEVIIHTGPMNSGKTAEMITAMTREKHAGRKIFAFKPQIDTRTDNKISSRLGCELDAQTFSNTGEFVALVETIRQEYPNDDIVIGIDEVQFCDTAFPEAVQYLATVLDCKVILAGLNRDFRGVPFGPLPTLLAMAQDIHVSSAICTHPDPITDKPCGKPATETYRHINNQPASFYDPVVVVGDTNEGYASRCLEHHQVPGKPKTIYSK